MSQARLPQESADYRKARAELTEAEIALKDQIERVAALRRRLPRDTVVTTDWIFQEGPRDLAAGDAPLRPVRLSDLFERPERPLVLVHFMFGGKNVEPCPMCTMWADGYDGVAHHIGQRANFAISVEGDLAAFRAYARGRGWSRLRLLSSQGSSCKRDLRMIDDDGGLQPGISVFTRDGDGTVRHFWTGEALMGPGHWRGIDLLSPVWNLFDLLPDGRGDWMPKRSYDAS